MDRERQQLRTAPAPGAGRQAVPIRLSTTQPRRRSLRSKQENAITKELRDLLTLPQHKELVLTQLGEHIKDFDLTRFKSTLEELHPDTAAAAAAEQEVSGDVDPAMAAVQGCVRRFRGAVRELCDRFPALRELVRAVTGEYERLVGRLLTLCSQRPDARLRRSITSCSRELVALKQAHADTIRRHQEAEARCRELEEECRGLRKAKRQVGAQLHEVLQLFGGLREMFPEIFSAPFAQIGGGDLLQLDSPGTPRSKSLMFPSIGQDDDWDSHCLPDEEEVRQRSLGVNAIIQKVAKEIEGLRADSENRVQETEQKDAGANQYLDEIVELSQLVEEWRAKAEAAQAAATELAQTNAANVADLQAAREIKAERDRLLCEAEIGRTDAAWLRLQVDVRQSVCDSFRANYTPQVCTRLADFGPVFAASWAARVPGRHRRDKYETWTKRTCPVYLRSTGKIPTARARLVSQQEAKVFVRDLFQTRPHIEQMAHVGKQSIDEYFSTYLHQKYNITEMMLEYAYSMMDCAQKAAAKDFDFAIWVRMLERTLPEAVWNYAEEQLEAVRANLPPVAKHAKNPTLQLPQVYRAIFEAFPCKTPDRVTMLHCAALATAEGSDVVDKEMLFSEGSRFANEVKRQLVYEQDELTYALWRALVSETPMHTDDGDGAKVPFSTVPDVMRRVFGDGIDVESVCQTVRDELERDLLMQQTRAGITGRRRSGAAVPRSVRQLRDAVGSMGVKKEKGLLQVVRGATSRARESKTDVERDGSWDDAPDVLCTPREVVAALRRTTLLRPTKPIVIDYATISDWNAAERSQQSQSPRKERRSMGQ
eukprot:TRINITY_DN7329_c0_g1_i1.p1 TRINITY_DN7329_c0_g1~~TRINITY_DN7329_c0_g1_i1.p1  ORF type:complete len:873 (+),score=292.63 TRINITY_DN7329_c0_g1_i1:155-2620(+)